MEKLMIIAKQFVNAVTEAAVQPFGKKLMHFKYRMDWELNPVFKRPGNAPLAVDVELCSYCNFRCVFCQQSSNWWNKEGKTVSESLMKWDIFTKIVDECVVIGVKSMKVNWRGEPMANKELPKYIAYMKNSGIHEVMMNTNASYINDDNSADLIYSGLDRIIFSCDGLSKETYDSLRVGGDFDIFMKNVLIFKNACKIPKSLGIKVPIIRINASVQEANKHEIPMFREHFKDIADEIRFNTVYNPQMKNKFLGKEHRVIKRKGCSQLYQRLIVSCEGDIIPCCVDYEKKLSVGNIKDITLKEAYGRRIQAYRRAHESGLGRRLSACDTCDNFSLSSHVNGKVVWS